ncbi:MAG: DUF192 domain-containing protein [Alphaproteobacteria bacterium]|nr:DUF192 domain-containing protein [Alphaproteobacteria bacterium]
MNGPVLARAAALLLLVGLALAAPAAGQSGAVLERSTLVVESAGGAIHSFDVELALSPDQKSKGLMHRREMAPDAGMLFVYAAPQIISMWMQNTYLPLDMVFIGMGGRVAHIVERTVPLSTAIVSSRERVVAVLELNAGTVSRLGLARGDRVRHALLGNGT